MFIIRRCVVQTELYFLKRSFFRYYSSVACSSSIQEEELIKSDNKQKLQGNKKLLKVAMLGLPNAGKSTLVNKLIHRSVCPTSSKVHTTMHKAEAMYTEGDTQIVFMDTPGLITTKEFDRYKLIETFKQDPANSVTEADLIAIVQDVTNVYTRHKFDDFVLDTIKNRKEDTQLLLILNKVDKLKKKLALLNVTRILTNKEHYPKFNDIFMVSALDGDGVDDLRNYLLDSAKIKDWKYETKFYTDQPLETIIEQTVRAKLMDLLPDEMPYKVKIRTEHCDFGDDGSIVSVVVLDCPRKNYVKMLLKKNCFKIKFLAFRVEVELRHAFRKPVFIKLNAICTKSELNK